MKSSEHADCILIHVPKLLEYDSLLGWNSKVNFIAMGMYSLVEELTNSGFSSHIVNLAAEKTLNPLFSIANHVKYFEAQVAAFSLHWHPQTYDSIEAARQVKEDNPDVFIVFGGYTSSYFAKDILENYPFIDAVIRGEGEKPLSELVKKILVKDSDLSEVPNLVWRNKEGAITENPITFIAKEEDINSWSFSAIDKVKNYPTYVNLQWMLPWEKAARVLFNRQLTPTIFGICFGRGCPGTCTWCGGSYNTIKNITGRCGTVWRSPEKIRETLETISHKFGINNFYACFDPSPENQTYLESVFEELGKITPKIKLDFECFGLPTKGFIESFQKNLHPESLILLSPEIANEELRKKHRAFYFSNFQMEEILDILEEKNIKTQLYFTFGLPDETMKDIKSTYKYQKYLKKKYKCITRNFFFPVEMEPGAPWFENPDKFGIKLKRKTIADFHQVHSEKTMSLGYETKHFSEKKILKIRRKYFGYTLSQIIFFKTIRFILRLTMFKQKDINLKQIRNHRTNAN